MRINKFDTDCDVLVIAEIGNNHEGSYSLAEELIGKAVEAGAGAVKFQTFLFDVGRLEWGKGEPFGIRRGFRYPDTCRSCRRSKAGP